jgi:hypothetical protein
MHRRADFTFADMESIRALIADKGAGLLSDDFADDAWFDLEDLAREVALLAWLSALTGEYPDRPVEQQAPSVCSHTLWFAGSSMPAGGTGTARSPRS